jgi:hypothetical protein
MVLLPKNTPDIEYGYNEPEFICEIDRAEITVGNWDAYVCRLFIRNEIHIEERV